MEDILEVKNLKVAFKGDFGKSIVTENVSFSVRKGELLCIVGESGCGKTVTNLAVMGLLPENASVEEGEIIFDGRNLLKLSENKLDEIRGKDLAMIYQDSLASLNPVFSIGNQIEEPLRVHLKMDKKSAEKRAIELLEEVGLPDAKKAMKQYPHELSGGMRQRVMIAMALSCHPRLLIADEPTTALDVTIQAQIMRLILKIQSTMDMSVILITHDIGLVAQMADRVLVMYAGEIIEEAGVTELFAQPRHPYTRALLASSPGIHDDEDRVLTSIRGAVPENYSSITGCRFADRCDFCDESCKVSQKLLEISPVHKVRCQKTSYLIDIGYKLDNASTDRKCDKRITPSPQKSVILGGIKTISRPEAAHGGCIDGERQG